MKTLVIMGAARKNGHTRQMVDLFLEHLDGEKEIVDAYRTEVQPCMDCRFCWKKKECVIKDGMQDIYQKLEEADNIVLASPMYFHSITGRMKTLIDRFQVYWAGHVRQDMPEKMLRRGAILSAECLGQVCLPNSDRDSLETRKDIADQVIALAEAMNQASESLDPYNKV